MLDNGYITNNALYYFKTINPNDFVIINGGDIGINPEAHKMNNIGLKNTNADVMMIGGDISYDNNFPE